MVGLPTEALAKVGGAMNGQATAIPGKLTAFPKTKRQKKSKAAAKKVWSFPKRTLAKIAASLSVFALLATGVFFYQRVYADRIYPKIMIAGFQIGGLSPQEAKQALAKKAAAMDEQGPEITYNDQTLKPKLSEMGVSFNIDEAVSQAYDFGRKGSFKEKITANFQILFKHQQITISPEIDQAKFDAYLGQLVKVAEKESKNVALEVQSGQIVLIPSEKGRGLDKEKLKNDLKNFINSGENGRVVMVTSDLAPKINEEGTIEARAQAEKFMAAAPITVTFEDSAWVADRTEIGSWINFKEDDNKLIATAQPDTFINSISKQVDIATIDREIQDGTGAVLSEGQDGRGTDTNTLRAQIRDALTRGQSGSFALATFAVPRGEKIIYPHAQPGRYTGRYIDINLSEQTLYAFEGSTLVNQFLISSGKRGYETPTGEFNVYSKSRANLMSGPDYYLPNVPWISRFAPGPISVHGTYWHSNFGTPMSHGCINASIPDAEWVYNFVDIGTPVYVHY